MPRPKDLIRRRGKESHKRRRGGRRCKKDSELKISDTEPGDVAGPAPKNPSRRGIFEDPSIRHGPDD